ncbi:MAG: fibronectin type III domain-containing protein [Spirochaetales bacterium]|nr:fibronectin type III domain-containing protein [Spirochaetales bacterium]
MECSKSKKIVGGQAALALIFLGMITAMGIFASSSCTMDLDPPGGILDIHPEASPGDFADHIVVTWPRVPGAEGYHVYVCDVDVGLYTKAEETLLTERQFEFQGVLPFFRYFFKISAVKDGIETPLSWSVSGWVKPGNPAVETAPTELKLSWDAVPGIELYLLEAAMTSDGPYYLMTSSSSDLVIEDPAYSYEINNFAFRFDAGLERPSVRLKVPVGDVWFKVRAVSEAGGDIIRSFGGVVEWRKS